LLQNLSVLSVQVGPLLCHRHSCGRLFHKSIYPTFAFAFSSAKAII
jgi:hypothetical protein